MNAWVKLQNLDVQKKALSPLERLTQTLLRLRRLADALEVLLKEPALFLLQIRLRSEGGLSGSYQWHRLRELRQILVRERPKAIIEFGPGASTYLLAKYSEQSLSLEESHYHCQKLVDTVNSLWLASPDLKRRIADSIVVRERVETLRDDVWVATYDKSDLDLTAFEVAYVDGPTNWPQKLAMTSSAQITLPNADALDCNPALRMIILDGRPSTSDYFKTKLQGDWEVCHEMELPMLSRRVFHTIFRLC